MNGLQLGVGVDTLVYENLSLRTEFDVNQYGTLRNNILNVVNPGTVQGGAVVAGGQTTTNITSNYRNVIEDQFNVALIWHFFG